MRQIIIRNQPRRLNGHLLILLQRGLRLDSILELFCLLICHLLVDDLANRIPRRSIGAPLCYLDDKGFFAVDLAEEVTERDGLGGEAAF